MDVRGTSEPEPRSFSPSVAISNQMVKLLADHIGRGPTKARTTLNTNLVVVTFGETMTRAEQNLVGAGEAGSVAATRRIFHVLMRDRAVAGVEEILGRRVIGYMADIDTESNMAMMAFVLGPRPESDSVEEAEQLGASGNGK